MRDSQGYFHREAAHADCRADPRARGASESIFPEALADERLVYYPFVNNALNISTRSAPAAVSTRPAAGGPARAARARTRTRRALPRTLLDRLLDDERWPCKANLRTRLHDMDELVGDIAYQSVYVTSEPAAA